VSKLSACLYLAVTGLCLTPAVVSGVLGKAMITVGDLCLAKLCSVIVLGQASGGSPGLSLLAEATFYFLR